MWEAGTLISTSVYAGVGTKGGGTLASELSSELSEPDLSEPDPSELSELGAAGTWLTRT